jgi:hypothetical protein
VKGSKENSVHRNPSLLAFTLASLLRIIYWKFDAMAVRAAVRPSGQ